VLGIVVRRTEYDSNVKKNVKRALGIIVRRTEYDSNVKKECKKSIRDTNVKKKSLSFYIFFFVKK